MKLKFAIKIFAFATAFCSSVTLSNNSAFSQTTTSRNKSNIKTVFRCLRNSDSNSYLTVATRGDIKPIPIISWTKTLGGGYTPKKRCKIVTNKLNRAVNDNGGYLSNLYLRTGRVNRQPVICVVNGLDRSCTNNNVLLTAKSPNRAEKILEQLATISTEGTNNPIEESSGGDRYLNLEKWVQQEELKIEDRRNVPDSSSSESEEKKPNSDTRI